MLKTPIRKQNYKKLLRVPSYEYDEFHQISSLKEEKKEERIDTIPEIWSTSNYKEYARFPAHLLSVPQVKEADSLYEVLLKRRSRREYSTGILSENELSTFLYFSSGITEVGGDRDTMRRSYPSAGARYPLEVYVILFSDIQPIRKGVYHYNIKQQSLELLMAGQQRNHVLSMIHPINASSVQSAQGLVIITAVFSRNTIKYGERGYRFILMEAGHLGQNFYLVGEALNVGVCGIGGFYDDEMNAFLDLEIQKEQCLYVLTFGKI